MEITGDSASSSEGVCRFLQPKLPRYLLSEPWSLVRETTQASTPTREPDEILEERVDDALDEGEQPHNKHDEEDDEGWTVDDEVCTDGSTVLRFFDASKLQPCDNSRRVWYVDDPHIERELVKTHDSAVGFYTLNGESLVEFTEDEKKERVYAVLE